MKLMTWKPVRWIGIVSYTSYLTHTGMLALVTPSSSLIVSALAFAVVIAYASLSGSLLEKRILRLRPSAWLIARRSKLQTTQQAYVENV